jgi:hypothetical protein
MLASLNNTNRKAFENNIQTAPKLREISSPFMNLYGIKGICYFRYFKDGKMVRLGTIEEWTQKFFQHQLYNSSAGDYGNLVKAMQNKEHLVIQSGQPQGELSETLFDLDIWNSCGIFRSCENSIEGFFLAGKKFDDRVISFFLNKREIVNHFIHFMKDKMEDEIHDESGYISSDLNFAELMVQTESETEKLIREEQNLLNSTAINHYFLRVKEVDISLTPRQYQIIQFLSFGLTCKEIARELDFISPYR